MNLGCKQPNSNCNFIWKYKVYFIPKLNSFKYEILIKGSHSNFLIGECTKYCKSISSKCILNDSIKESNSKIRSLNITKNQNNINEFNSNLFVLDNKVINSKRYIVSKNEEGTYENCFNKAFEFF